MFDFKWIKFLESLKYVCDHYTRVDIHFHVPLASTDLFTTVKKKRNSLLLMGIPSNHSKDTYNI